MNEDYGTGVYESRKGKQNKARDEYEDRTKREEQALITERFPYARPPEMNMRYIMQYVWQAQQSDPNKKESKGKTHSSAVSNWPPHTRPR